MLTRRVEVQDEPERALEPTPEGLAAQGRSKKGQLMCLIRHEWDAADPAALTETAVYDALDADLEWLAGNPATAEALRQHAEIRAKLPEMLRDLRRRGWIV